MIASETILTGSGLALLVGAGGFALGARALPAATRRFGYAVVLACAGMGVAYLLMAAGVLTVTTSGREESAVRFLGYSVAMTVGSVVIGALAGASTRRTGALVGGNLLAVWGTLGSWVFSGTGETVATVLILVSFLGVAVLLLGPMARTARTVHAERTLLYGKLRNLVLLAWASLIVLGAISAQTLGLTDAFVGQLAATYVDLVFLFGFGLLLFRNADALEYIGTAGDADTGSQSGDEPYASTGVSGR
ncbi:homolog to rhodopsin [Natrialba magadii ATCC 43099]|uniref:Rhodopsin n=1 Tax=Natrialba magadii (strain ATCC 43099 / DSM 3394 / CCM 3739 / CIP 104546 / IAM 13178 / JCM 8861 / NBRC 102185 / NCIMB 2190 / MS3) TaxID=547559 RepID=D3T0F3_NATMM|nr:bacteriorhodopsin [Natrialba magadii]ADD06432.1 homolog to rhodopsin [Natrialba magadii ATCC 43099]ELY31681.1 rhodopsin [Natrialba magadii ATCC 43099]